MQAAGTAYQLNRRYYITVSIANDAVWRDVCKNIIRVPDRKNTKYDVPILYTTPT